MPAVCFYASGTKNIQVAQTKASVASGFTADSLRAMSAMRVGQAAPRGVRQLRLRQSNFGASGPDGKGLIVPPGTGRTFGASCGGRNGR